MLDLRPIAIREISAHGVARYVVEANPCAHIGRSIALAVKLLLATCTRIGDLTCAEWSHVDFERKEWTIPPEHTKNGKQFVIPLTNQTAEWFMELKRIAFSSKYVLDLFHDTQDLGDLGVTN